jgi:uroporphyrinogen decarboxylase
MDKRSRIQAALQGQEVDRVPLSLWRHFFCEDRTAQDLGTTTVTFAHEYDLDLVKLTPCGLYAVEDWSPERITYPGNDYDPPYLQSWAVINPADWHHLPFLEPTVGALGRELNAVRLVAKGLAGKTPFLMTIFSPLTLAFKLAGERVIAHLREHPADLHTGLETIAATTTRLAGAALEAGADGLFFATQLASHHWLKPAEYEAFGQRYDLAVLEAVAGQSSVTVLHLHGEDIFFDLVNRYPIHAVSWHDQETPPTLAQAREFTDRTFITGLDRELLDRGPASVVREQVRQALVHTQGKGLILAPSCVIPPTTPASHLDAVREALL